MAVGNDAYAIERSEYKQPCDPSLADAVRDSDLGLHRGVVELSPASSGWADAFSSVSDVLKRTRPPSVSSIEHIGSTAVPGLCAKAILDIAVGLDRDAELQPVHDWLVGLGFLCRGEQDSIRPDLMYGLELTQNVRVINVHVVEHAGSEWRQYIGFRENLRRDARGRDMYGALKQRLAMKYRDDRLGYIEGKASFIVERRR